MSAGSDGRAVVAALPMPALVVGSDARIVMANAAAADLLGHDGVGRHYVTLLRQPDIGAALDATGRDGAPRQAVYAGTEGGRDTRWVVALRSLGPGEGVLAVFTDETATAEAGSIRRDFVGNVSHELKMPLTGLLGMVETLLGPARDDPAARDRFLTRIDAEARRMARLIDDLLALSRLEAEQRRRPTAPVDLASILRDVVAECAALHPTTRVALDAPDRAVLPGDPAQLRQIAANLIENGAKYGGGIVAVRLSGPSPSPALGREVWTLEVQDHGPGIAAHHIPRLTERFYRVDTHRSRDVGGTGLGLAIVKHAVARHRGRLRITSEPGQGSLFQVLLPSA